MIVSFGMNCPRCGRLTSISLREFLPSMPLGGALTPAPEFFALSFIGDPPLLRAIHPSQQPCRSTEPRVRRMRPQVGVKAKPRLIPEASQLTSDNWPDEAGEGVRSLPNQGRSVKADR
jgi:hypothetical protein